MSQAKSPRSSQASKVSLLKQMLNLTIINILREIGYSIHETRIEFYFLKVSCLQNRDRLIDPENSLLVARWKGSWGAG